MALKPANDILLLEFYQTRDIKIRNQIVQANMGLVGLVAKKMLNCCNIPIEDLIQIGSMGLIKAIEGFNPNRKIKFSGYAFRFINGAILQYIRDKSHLVKVPRGLQELHQKIKRYAQHNGLTYEQAAVSLEINLADAREAAIACNQINPGIHDISSVQPEKPPLELINLLGRLPELHAKILSSLYIDQISITAASKLYGLKFREIRKIEKESIEKLRLIAQGEVQCPNCGSCHTVKNGRRGNKQSYLCRSCKFQFRENALPRGRQGYADNIKIKVLEFLAEGKSSYWCETYLGIDHTTAFLWSKTYVIQGRKILRKRMIRSIVSE